MSERLPPLTALRAFDAAARHMSFARAADELNVTPAALSFQIKSLEEHLGQSVFRRLNRAVELTEAGAALVPGTRDGFAALGAAWAAARRVGDTSTIRVTAGPAFTAKWLAPRMFAFATAHPEIEMRFTASLRLLDLDRDDIDVAIRFGFPHDEPVYSRALMAEWVSPMMSPALAAEITTPEALRQATLLHQEDLSWMRPAIDWQAWFTAAGLGEVPAGGPRFSQADHALDTALSGAGVVLGRVTLAARDLLEGRLVAPFPLSLTTDALYRVLCTRGAETRPHIAAFLDWIDQEARIIEPLAEGRRFIPAAEVSRSSG